MKATILLVDDDINLAGAIADYLRSKDYEVHTAADGQEGLDKFYTGHYDLCISDVKMPVLSGIDMLKHIRKSGSTTPIMMLSEHTATEHIVLAYKDGCDDYISKPCSMEVLVCKIEAMLNRTQQQQEVHQETSFELGPNLRFDAIRQTLGNMHLSTRENELLLMLCRELNNPVSRSRILMNIWNQDNYFASRSLSVYINHLRGYLKEVGCTWEIMSVHGKGYKIVEK